MTDDLLITTCRILAEPDADLVDGPGFLLVRDGRIHALGPMADCPTGWTGTVVDGQGQLALPGLVNGHCHLPMTLFRGLADDLALADWLTNHIFPAEARHIDPETVYWGSRLAAAELLLAGVTCVADGYFLEDEAARACLDAGLRCVAAQGIIDFPAPGVPDPGRNIEAAAKFLDRWQDRNPLITPALFVHSPYTVANDTLREAKALARRRGVRLFVHAAETRDEINHIAAPLAPTPIGHLDALGVLDADTTCVHCVWADETDLDTLARRGAAVVSCPQSNAKLASGVAPLAAMLARGLRVGLGTDGAASNNSLDLFREMDLAARLQSMRGCDPKPVPARRMLDLATRGGAAAIGLDAGHGRLTVGAPADLILVDLEQPRLQPFHSLGQLVHAGSGADVRTVIVGGRLVVHERQLRTMDLDETLERVRSLAGRVGS